MTSRAYPKACCAVVQQHEKHCLSVPREISSYLKKIYMLRDLKGYKIGSEITSYSFKL